MQATRQDQHQQPVRLEDVRQVGARIGRSKSWIHAAIKRGEFPAASRISARCTRWKSTDVDRWIEAQFSGKGTK
ncbi:MAG: AlpA family phage regulatory protein [Burkholderiales bacterium]|nr:AlpA family phage regulatory protein [Burkholderiales bacterium]